LQYFAVIHCNIPEDDGSGIKKILDSTFTFMGFEPFNDLFEKGIHNDNKFDSSKPGSWSARTLGLQDDIYRY